jgi:uncharacterized protein YdeI (YjbR/CyaY-like superfamily)
MNPPQTSTPQLHMPTRAAWREWLAQNHATQQNVWLKIYKKQSQTSSVQYNEAVDEALCFGWIDSSIKKGDDDFYLQFFAKRNPKSNWSKVNKAKVTQLTAAGLMTEAGQRMIDLAQQTGTWDALNDVENLLVPNDLAEALASVAMATERWEAFSRSTKRGILEWILNAKRPETRQERVEKTARMAARNLKANFDKE